MKYSPMRLVRHSFAGLLVFALTFTAGFTATSAILGDQAPGSSLGAYILRTGKKTSSSSARSVSSRKAVQRKKVMRTLKRALITRPSTRRNGSGSDLDVVHPAPRSRAPIKASCGDGLWIPDLQEDCDDGNTANSDGCSSVCKVESGFYCLGNPSDCIARCGDGIKTPVERCDDGNTTNDDGCSSLCKIEMGYICPGSPSKCEFIPYCGDGVKASTEQCDDGNSEEGDGCFECKTE